MQAHRQELVRSASRRIQRGRRATGRIVASALGFGLAYYFDSQNGAERRQRLHQAARRTFRHINGALTPEAVDPPVFSPILREQSGTRPAPRVGVAR
jgi:hypothetical protein